MSTEQPLRIAYLTLQRTAEGVASYAHVIEIIRGFERRDCTVELFEVPGNPNWKPGRFLLTRIIYFFILQARLIRRLGEFDVIYIRSHSFAYPTSRAALRKGIPVFHEINGTSRDLTAAYPITKPIQGIFSHARNWQFKRANGLITVTPGIRDWVIDECGDAVPVAVIPNGANHELFRPDAARPADVPDRYLVFVAALAPWQGIDVLIQALDHPAWPQDIDLLIVGSGEGKERVDSAAALHDRVHYLGRRPYAEIPGLVANSLGGLSPQTDYLGRSQFGLFPLKVFETMASGVPVIVTDFPGQSEMVREGGYGLVIPADDPGALAEACAKLADPARAAENEAMGRAGRKGIEEQHSWDCRARDTLAFIRKFI